MGEEWRLSPTTASRTKVECTISDARLSGSLKKVDDAIRLSVSIVASRSMRSPVDLDMTVFIEDIVRWRLLGSTCPSGVVGRLCRDAAASWGRMDFLRWKRTGGSGDDEEDDRLDVEGEGAGMSSGRLLACWCR